MQTATPVLSLVRPETHVLAYLAKWALRALFLFGVVVALASQAAAAPEVFKASGEFTDGVLSGTITIDTATGKLVSVDLIISAGYGEVVFSGGSSHSSGNLTRIFASGRGPYGLADLTLFIPVATLVDYEGGKLVGYPYGGWGYRDEDDYGATYFLYGSLTSTGTEVSPD